MNGISVTGNLTYIRNPCGSYIYSVLTESSQANFEYICKIDFFPSKPEKWDFWDSKKKKKNTTNQTKKLVEELLQKDTLKKFRKMLSVLVLTIIELVVTGSQYMIKETNKQILYQ